MNRPTRNTFVGFAIILLLMPFYACSKGSAAFDTGNDLLAYCTDKLDLKQALCAGLISGYFEGMQVSFTCSGYSPKITRQQLIDMVVADLVKFPATRHQAAAPLALATFMVAFHCLPSKT